jgi:hypothetical protein
MTSFSSEYINLKSNFFTEKKIIVLEGIFVLFVSPPNEFFTSQMSHQVLRANPGVSHMCVKHNQQIQ